MADNVQVVTHTDGWAVKRENGKRARFVHPRQADAIKSARQLASRDWVELIVHGEDGQIRLRDSYGNDPFPARG